MKNLFLSLCLLLSFAVASAQQTTPTQTKQPKTKTDTVHSKKSKHTTQKSTGKTKDTLNKPRTQKKGKSGGKPIDSIGTP